MVKVNRTPQVRHAFDTSADVALADTGDQIFIWVAGDCYKYDAAATEITDINGRAFDLDGSSSGSVAGASFGFYASAYGAVGDGVTDDLAAIQAAADAAAAAGGGHVFLSAGTYIVSGPIILKSKCYLVGQGRYATIIKAEAAMNDWVVESYLWDANTAGFFWYVADGVQYDLGLKNIGIDGNKANQTAGGGVRLYAKNPILEDVLIFNTYSHALHTRCGATVGQTDETDMPEGRITGLWTRSSGGVGWLMEGPHDLNANEIYIALAGSYGFHNVFTTSQVSGSCSVGKMHVYACTDYGVYVQAKSTRFETLDSESNAKEGIYIDAADCQIGLLRVFGNCSSTGSFQVLSTSNAEDLSITNLLSLSTSAANLASGGVQIGGDSSSVSVDLDGFSPSATPSTGVGVSLATASNKSRVTGRIKNFSGTGGIGFKTNDGGTARGISADLHIYNCKTIWNNAAAGEVTDMRIRGEALSGQTTFSGTAQANSERWSGVIATTGQSTAFGPDARVVAKPSADLVGVNPSAGYTVALASEDYDTAGWHDGTTNNERLTVPTGIYRCRLGFDTRIVSAITTDSFIVQIIKNGTTVISEEEIPVSNSTFRRGNIATRVIAVTPGDYFTAVITSSTDTSITVYANYTYFWAEGA